MDKKEHIVNDKILAEEENQPPLPATKSSDANDVLPHIKQEEQPIEELPHEKEIDLNELFPDTETNLNDLFSDLELKHLLKSITKNKKDMSAIKERLTAENQTSDKESELIDGDAPGCYIEDNK